MRKIMFAVLAALCLVLPALGQDPDSTAGPGAPSAQSPVPDCIHFKKYRDTLTGNLWTASGVPCSWVQAGGAGYAGVTSDGSNGLNLQGVTYADGKKQIAAAYNTPGITVSSTCPPNSNTCVKVYADTQYETDCTTNATTTVTCPSGNFTSADVGKVFWATTQGTGGGVGYLLYTTLLCSQTTIASVTNSTTIVLTAACSGSGSGNSVAIWGHDDGPTLAGLDSIYGCNVVHIATGNTFIMTGQGFFKTAPSSTQCNQQLQTTVGAPGPALIGEGQDASQAVIILTPNFNWAACPSGSPAVGCIGSQARALANLQIWGTGHNGGNCSAAQNHTVTSANSASSVIHGVDVGGICPGQTWLTGVLLNNLDEIYTDGGAQSVGQFACFANQAGPMISIGNDCRNDNVAAGKGLNIANGAQLVGIGNVPLVDVYINGTGSELDSYSSNIQAGADGYGIYLDTGASYYSYRDKVSGNVRLNTLTSTMVSQGTSFTGGTLVNSGAMNSFRDSFSNSITNNSGASIVTQASTYGAIANSGTIVSNGYNKLGSIPTVGGTWTGVGVLSGTIQGTLTASTTLGFYGFGQWGSPTGNTTVNQGLLITALPLSGSVFGLEAFAGSAATTGTNTVTVMRTRNGVTTATALTCNLSTGTGCVDFTHFDTAAVGDVYSCQILTGGATPPANVMCTLIDW